MVWELFLDGDGELRDVGLVRALVRSRAKLSYQRVQRDLDAGTLHPSVTLLPEVGVAAEEEIERGVDDLPDQEIVADDGAWDLAFRQLTRVEEYNAQISLLASSPRRAMIDGEIEFSAPSLPRRRTPVERLRRAAAALGIGWPPAGRTRRCCEPSPRTGRGDLAFLTRCTTLFRGAGYLAFERELPDGNLLHGALAAPYAHHRAAASLVDHSRWRSAIRS